MHHLLIRLMYNNVAVLDVELRNPVKTHSHQSRSSKAVYTQPQQRHIDWALHPSTALQAHTNCSLCRHIQLHAGNLASRRKRQVSADSIACMYVHRKLAHHDSQIQRSLHAGSVSSHGEADVEAVAPFWADAAVLRLLHPARRAGRCGFVSFCLWLSMASSPQGRSYT